MESLILMGVVVLASFLLIAVLGTDGNPFTDPSPSPAKDEDLDMDGDA